MSDLNRASTDEVDMLVGKAWSQHYNGQHDAAIRAFKDLVERYPEHIDANYGLALSYKGAGQKEAAAEGFRRTKSLLEASIKIEIGGEINSRAMMLSRLCDQHLAML